jgi:putative resolvase
VQIGREARIPITEVERLLGKQRAWLLVLYGRVSGHDQQPDLQRQEEQLEQWALVARTGRKTLTLTDIGSGLGTERTGYGVTLTVLSPDEELTQDLLAIIASFAGRLYGLRSRKQRQLLACAKQVIQQRMHDHGQDANALLSHSPA